MLAPLTNVSYQYPTVDIAVLPELSLMYSLSNNHIFKLMYGEAINRPPIYRLNNTAKFGIKPEYIRSLELNYIGVFMDKLKFNSSIIYNNLHQLIINDFIIENDGTIVNLIRNGGNISVIGIETDFELRPIKSLKINISGNYYYAENENDTKVYPAFSPHFLGYFKISYKFKEISIGLTSNFVSAMKSKYSYEPIDPSNTNYEPVGRVGQDSPSYLNIGTNIRYQPKKLKKAFANLRISNILNQKMYYPVNDFNPWATRGTLGIGITGLLTFGYEF